ncbi:MAG TPA: hypothetical protein VK158_06360, partial [Acidobacteriota bacterium]|nr:hypothetical protein [Acidobacteriota bacterium]
MSLTKILRNAVPSAALLLGAYTANAQTSPKTVIADDLIAWTALPLQGVSVDANKVRAVGNGTTYNYDLALTTGTTNINSGNVTDLATGLSTNEQTTQQFGTGGIYGYNNTQPTLPVLTYNGPANSLGVGGATKEVVGKGKTTSTAVYQTFLDNNGTFKLLQFSTGTATPKWTLTDK